MKPRLLDLFCGAGGAAKGYQRAGFYVVGVDNRPQPRYCGDEFVQADALEVLNLLCERADDLEPVDLAERREELVGDRVGAPLVAVGGFDVQVDEDFAGHGAPFVGVSSDSPKPAFRVKDFDAVHASPPCQHHTSMQTVARNADAHPDLIEPTRALLEETGLPYVLENVVGARKKMPNSFELCGSMFGLGADTHLGRLELRRHRLFETNWPWLVPGRCQHRGRVIGLYGDHARSDRRHNSQSQFRTEEGLRHGREAMEMPWSDWHGIKEAIPPAYTELIGAQLLARLHYSDRPQSVAPKDFVRGGGTTT